MSDPDTLDIFNIETLLIESNHMAALESSLESIKESYLISDELIDEIKWLIYSHYYMGRLDSNKYTLSGLKKYITNNNINEYHKETIQAFVDLSERQFS